jgi:hypothetical protein
MVACDSKWRILTPMRSCGEAGPAAPSQVLAAQGDRTGLKIRRYRGSQVFRTVSKNADALRG